MKRLAYLILASLPIFAMGSSAAKAEILECIETWGWTFYIDTETLMVEYTITGTFPRHTRGYARYDKYLNSGLERYYLDSVAAFEVRDGVVYRRWESGDSVTYVRCGS